jgi:hypothetical protein
MSCDRIVPCIPDLCTFAGLQQGCVLPQVKVDSLNLYLMVGTVLNTIPLAFEGVIEKVQTDFTDWYLRLVAFQMLPPFLVTLTISFDVTLVLIVLLIVLTVLVYLWITDDVVNVIFNLDDVFKNTLTNNWNKYQDRIKCSILQALINPKSLTCLPDSNIPVVNCCNT